jgi:16S rRNA processing protein RimM
VRPHGLKGEVVVAVHSDNPERFAPGATFSTASSKPRATLPARLKLVRATPHKTGLRAIFEGISDREAAELIAGVELSVPRSALPESAAGSYYLFELVGCRCIDERDGELGTVVELIADGGGWLVEVEKSADGKRRRLLLPFVSEFLLRVDRERREIHWRLPEGLVEACASES